MTISKSEVITIPKWLVIVLFPIIIGGITGYAASKASAAKVETKTELLQKEVEKKANQTEFLIIQKQMDRIEGKLDKHIGGN